MFSAWVCPDSKGVPSSIATGLNTQEVVVVQSTTCDPNAIVCAHPSGASAFGHKIVIFVKLQKGHSREESTLPKQPHALGPYGAFGKAATSSSSRAPVARQVGREEKRLVFDNKLHHNAETICFTLYMYISIMVI